MRVLRTVADVRAFPASRRHPHFAREALNCVAGRNYDLVFATSSRLMTAALGAASWANAGAAASTVRAIKDLAFITD